MLCSSDKDKRIRLIYATPAGDSQVRLMAIDGSAMLCLKVNALHDLQGPVLVEPVAKTPAKGKHGMAQAQVSDVPPDHHPLREWKLSLEKWMPKRGEEGLQAIYDSKLLLKLAKACDLMGCRMGFHARPSAAAAVTLLSGDISPDEVGLALLMPCHRPIDDPFDLEEIWTNFDRFTK